MLAPVFVLALAAALMFFLISRYRDLRHNEMPSYVILGLACVTTTVAILVQLYITRSGSGSEPFIQQITMAGGIVVYPYTLFAALLAGAASFIVLLSKMRNRPIVDPVLLFCLASVLFTGVIYLIQQYYIQANAYYFHKSLTLVIVALAILAAIGLAYFMPHLLKSIGKLNSFIVAVLSFAVLVFVVYPNPVVIKYSAGPRPVSNNTNLQLKHLLTHEYSLENFEKKHVTLYYPFDNATLNEVGSTLLKSNRIRSDCYTLLKVYALPTKITDFDPTVVNIPECKGYSVTLYVDPEYEATTKDKLRPFPSASVKVIAY